MSHIHYFIFFLYIFTTKEVHSVPRECKIKFETTENDFRCTEHEAYELVATNELECKKICYVGHNKDKDKLVKIFFTVKENKILMLRYEGKRTNYGTPVYFHGIDKYIILKSNLYNGIIQTVIKSGNHKIIGFIDITQETKPTVAVPIGNWILSDVLLRDENTIVAVKVDNTNNILKSEVSMRNPKLVWEMIPSSIVERIRNIEIHGNRVHIFTDDQVYNISLFVEKESTELPLKLVHVTTPAQMIEKQEAKFVGHSSSDIFGFKKPQDLCNPKGGTWNGFLQRCVCRKNYYGYLCQFVKNCHYGSNFNNKCLCNYGWQGDFCDKIQCFNGHPMDNFTKCECFPRFAGMYCDSCKERYQKLPSCSPFVDFEDLEVPCSSTSEIYYLVFFFVSVFVIIFLGCTIVVAMRRRRIEVVHSPRLSPELEAFLIQKQLQPCPTYEEALRQSRSSRNTTNQLQVIMEEEEIDQIEQVQTEENGHERILSLHV